MQIWTNFHTFDSSDPINNWKERRTVGIGISRRIKANNRGMSMWIIFIFISHTLSSIGCPRVCVKNRLLQFCSRPVTLSKLILKLVILDIIRTIEMWTRIRGFSKLYQNSHVTPMIINLKSIKNCAHTGSGSGTYWRLYMKYTGFYQI